MSILIRGADISPDHIQDITVFPEGFAVVEEYEMLVPIKTTKCEVVSVPTPHGRLVDVDIFDSIKYEIPITLLQQYERGFDDGVKYVQKLIIDAPTVIEAEEG